MYLQQNGFVVTEVNTSELYDLKERFHIPAELYSCHTAVVDGYIIEGHVPAADINRLLAERPAIHGLAVAGMPVGSPGMGNPAALPEPYNVVAFTKLGDMYVFASYQ